MFLSADDYRAEARRLLPRFVFDYIDGAANDGMCLRRNRSALESMMLTPRVLRDTTTIDTSIEVFGTRWCLPMGIASAGLNCLVRLGGDAMLASAAEKAGAAFALSTASTIRVKDVRAATPTGSQWMQLCVMRRAKAEHLVRRAREAGYKTLVLTVDVPVSGNCDATVATASRSTGPAHREL